MAADEAYVRGLELLVNDNLDGALAELTQALSLEERPQFFEKRAAVHARRKDWQASRADAENALALQSENHHALFYKAEACFNLEDFSNAKEAVLKAKDLAKRDADFLAKLDTLKLKIETELGQDEIVLEEQAQAKPQSEAQAQLSPPKGFPVDWYQSLKKVTIEVEAKGIPPEKVKHEITSTSVTLDIELGSSDQTFSYDWELYAEIDPANSKLAVRPKMIEFTLAKKEANLTWPQMEAKAGSSTAMFSAQPAPASQPPKPYASGKDWDSLAKEFDEDEKPEGDEALNKLFKDIYAKADPDTRRAMMKSFQTSGGTVLSTNWEEVAEKNYEKQRPAPSGMVWKDYEGNVLEVDDEEDKKKFTD